VQAAITQLKPRSGTKRIIVLTNGQDEGSVFTLEQVVKSAVGAGIAVDIISTGPAAARAASLMRTLSTRTQGTLVNVPTGSTVTPALKNLVVHAQKTSEMFQLMFKSKPATDLSSLDHATVSLVMPSGERVTQPMRARLEPHPAR
jgi:hypothetical protein